MTAGAAGSRGEPPSVPRIVLRSLEFALGEAKAVAAREAKASAAAAVDTADGRLVTRVVKAGRCCKLHPSLKARRAFQQSKPKECVHCLSS